MCALILRLSPYDASYAHATETFRYIYMKITECQLSITYGTDDYSLLLYVNNGRRIVIFAGDRARSTVYSIYDFFDRFADCHYFRDGDIIPKRENIILDNFYFFESPRFECRGELRERVLAYARKLALIYPADCGTMTHWYSRTPAEFLERKAPSFLQQAYKQYTGNDTGKVWDFRQEENMRNYMYLTETMVNEYEKRTDYFHTIVLVERAMFADKKKNHTLKLIAYRRICENLRQRYPKSKLFIASLDFVGWWTEEEVQKLIGELDPQNTIILDKRMEERLSIAVAGPYCKGMILYYDLLAFR